MNSFITISNVLIRCCLNSFLMEIMMSISPNSANLVTFLQFFFTTSLGFLSLENSLFNPKIPLRQYIILVSLFFITSAANNYVYALHVASTLHMIIRSASSPASMLVYWLVRKQRPRANPMIGSVIISIGVSLATYGGASTFHDTSEKFTNCCLGIFILMTMLIVGAFLGIKQEMLFKEYGSQTKEMLFFTHALPLPMFSIIYQQLYQSALPLTLTSWFILILNVMTYYYCTLSVHELASKNTSINVNLILTLRKFISLLISTLVFKNNLTFLHVTGTVFVSIGTCIYYDFFSPRKQSPVKSNDSRYNTSEMDN